MCFIDYYFTIVNSRGSTVAGIILSQRNPSQVAKVYPCKEHTICITIMRFSGQGFIPIVTSEKDDKIDKQHL